MKKVIYIFFILVSLSAYAQVNGDILTTVDEMPVPPGGTQSFYQYITKNLNVPPEVFKYHLGGDCQLRFVVKSDGTTGLFKVIGSVAGCAKCDKEAINVIRFCQQKWTPGKKDGKAVNTYYEMPIRFDGR